ncbi:MAG: Rpn family recombination-promoting nuclease/putative transposase [Bacteroidota bacterium]
MTRKIPSLRQKVNSKFDLFFSKSMELAPVAEAFARYFLPGDFKAEAKYETLTRVDRVHTDAKLQQRRQDIAYEMEAGKLGKVMLSGEHQSSPDRLMIPRGLYYTVDNMALYMEAGEPVPTMLNFIIYHGKPSPQPYPIHPEECFGCPEVAKKYLNFKFILIDLNKYSDADLLKTGHCAILLLLLKHGRDGNFELRPEEYRLVFEKTIAAVGDSYIYSMLQCAESLSDEVAGKRACEVIEQVLINKNDIIMTYGDRVRQESKKEGIQEGIKEGKKEGKKEGMREGMQTKADNIAKSMLQDRAPVEQVSKWTGLDVARVNTLRQSMALS